jgi:hypothetical protein
MGSANSKFLDQFFHYLLRTSGRPKLEADIKRRLIFFSLRFSAPEPSQKALRNRSTEKWSARDNSISIDKWGEARWIRDFSDWFRSSSRPWRTLGLCLNIAWTLPEISKFLFFFHPENDDSAQGCEIMKFRYRTDEHFQYVIQTVTCRNKWRDGATVEPLIRHTPRETAKGMRYEGYAKNRTGRKNQRKSETIITAILWCKDECRPALTTYL